jgi:parallel beta-helix repeat protein
MSERMDLITIRHKVAIVVVACMLSFLATLVSMPDNVLATNHGGWITMDETWYKTGNPHNILRDVRVMPRVTLTILEGVNVSFNLGTTLYVDGDLLVYGIGSEPVRFSSSSFMPQRGDWGSIHFNSSGGGGQPSSTIDDAIIEYGSSGIYVYNRSLNIRNCTIRENLIGIDSNIGALLVETNSIYSNTYDGINWTGWNSLSALASIVGNNITNNGGNGINGSAGATVAMNANSISFNKNGIHFVDSTPATSQNTVNDNSEDGIYFLRSGNGTSIHNNTIANNSKNGIWVNISKVRIDNNTIDHNGVNGTYAVNYDGTFENNTVLSNSGSGIQLNDSSPHVYNNTILSNRLWGVLGKRCECRVLSNNISFNGGGFTLQDSHKSAIEWNELWSSGSENFVARSNNVIISNNTIGVVGTTVLSSDNVSVWTNSVESPPYWGFRFSYSSNISFGDNMVMRSAGGCGIRFIYSENVTATNNTVLHKSGTAVDVQTSVNVVMQRNNITTTGEGYNIGIFIGGSTNVNVTNNNKVTNHEVGIEVYANNVDIVIYDNTSISDNVIGIKCTDSSPIILNNTIEDNGIGVKTISGSTPEIRGNNIEGNTDYGVENEDSSVYVDAQNNWWGAADGPGWPGGSGSGDSVSPYVDFVPWLTQLAF